MKTVTSISGGKTSAYLAVNYPSDYNVFALVRIEDDKCKFPDEKLRREIEDRIQAPFIGTAEEDEIIYTILDLEQYLGREIKWVTGVTYEQHIREKSMRLPNIAERSCTTILKMIPIAYWWLTEIGEPVEMAIGYRANEVSRANDINNTLNKDGLSEIKLPVSMRMGIRKGKTFWYKQNEVFAWRKPTFKLIEDNIYKIDIQKFWIGKPVRFAKDNNCVGCFERHPMFLAKKFVDQPKKMQWFADQETPKRRWKKDILYNDLKKWKSPLLIDYDDMPGCWSGFCEVA